MNLSIIIGDDKQVMRSKVVSWFFILMMLSGMILIFSPDSVSAYTHTISFESGTLNNPYSDLFMTTTNVNMEEFEVDNVYVYEGSKSFRVHVHSHSDNGGWWNLSHGPNEILQEISWWNSLHTDGSSALTYVNMFNSQQFADGDLGAEISFGAYNGNCIISMGFHITGNKITYYDHNDVEQVIGPYTDGDFYHFNMSFNATDEIFFEYSDVEVTGEPTNITAVQAGLSIDRIYFHITSGEEMEIDNVVFNSYIPGNTTINVYNETSPITAIPDWNLRIYDDSSVIQYSKNTLDNPITVNHTEYGTGNMFFEISASGYYNRTYYADIKTGIHYLLNAFLLNTGNADAHVYTCIVVDDSDLDHIIYINDAEIVITRFINGSIHEISSGFTDGSGRFYVPLIAGVTYTVNITATGYDNLQDTYIPSSTVFEQTFRMASSSPTSTTYDDFWDNISIDISMDSAGCMQDGNITITYLDSNSSTTNTEIRLWEIYGPNNTLLNTWVNTSNSFFNIQGSINTTRVHYMSLYFNNTAFFPVSQPMNIMIPNVDSSDCEGITPFDLDDRITQVVGPFTIEDRKVPWENIIATFIPIILLVAFGPFNTGLGIIMCGVSMTMIEGFFAMYLIGGFEWKIAGIGAFVVILGILYMMTKGTGGDHL